MAKADLITELASLGISSTQGTGDIPPLTGDETVAELEAIIEKAKVLPVSPPPQQRRAAYQPDYSFAVNVVKLNRSKAFVAQTQPTLNGKELEDAVRSRYIDLNGLLRVDAPTGRGKGKGRVVNMSDDDGQ